MMIQNKKNQKMMKEIRDKIQNHLKLLMAKNIENDDPVNSDIELYTNVVKNTELSTSESVARKMTEIPDEKIDTEEEMDFYDLNKTGDYSDYDILE